MKKGPPAIIRWLSLTRGRPQVCAGPCKSAVIAAGEAFHAGKVWTTDAPYRETEAKVREYGSQGILAVEMEMSALFTVARFRGVALAGLLVVSDELSNLTWRHGLRDNRFRRNRHKAVRAALDALFD